MAALRSNYYLLRKLSPQSRTVSSGAPWEPMRSVAFAAGLLLCRCHASTNMPQQPSSEFASVQDLEGPAGPSSRIIFEKAVESLPAKSKEKVHLLPQNLPSRPAKVVKKVDDNSLRHNSLLVKPASLQRGDQCIPMKAFYISRSVDLKALKDEALIETMSYTRTTLVARCKYCTVGPPYLPQRVGTPWTSGPFLVVFHYGSAVLVNFMLQDEEDLYLNLVKKHCVESLDHTEEARKDGNILS